MNRQFFKFQKIIFLPVLIFGFFGIALFAHAAGNLSGYAWADNGIGWISFNCSNAGVCGLSNYGVSVSSTNPGVLSGYAWANPNDAVAGTNNIGWISFNQAELTGCPFGTCIAQLDRSTGQVSGWARACGVFAGGCSGSLRPSSDLGGWDGWIHLSGTGYGVSVSGCTWSGYGWGGGTVPGWIHFAGSGYGVTGIGDGCASGSTIVAQATLNGAVWAGLVNYSLSGASSYSGASVAQTFSGATAGSYTFTYVSGGPAGAAFANITPSTTQTLSVNGTITFTMNFNTPPPPPASVSMTVAPQNVCKVVNVSWLSSSGATGYNAQRCTDAACSVGVPVPACSALAPAISCTDTAAPDGIRLWYRVNAYNGFGTSAWAYSASSITNNAPDVSFNYTPSSIIAINQLVKFAGQLLGGNATTSQSWTFAGGNPSSSASSSPSASFATAGSHAVSYTAQNASGSCVVSGSVSVSQNVFGDWCELPPDAPPGTPCP